MNTELRQKVFLRVSISELHTDKIKKDAPGFLWHMMNKHEYILVILVCITYSSTIIKDDRDP